jgi:signal peptidase II
MCDQLSKWWLVAHVMQPEHVERVTSFMNFVLVWNRGMIFGLLGRFDPHLTRYFLLIIAALIMFLLGRWLFRTNSTPVAVGLGFIMGGALGNIVDRVRYGAVVDFIDLHMYGYHWYAFNLADAAIDVGIACLLLDSIIRGR